MRPFFGQTNYRFALKISPFSYQLPSLFSGLEENKKNTRIASNRKKRLSRISFTQWNVRFPIKFKTKCRKYKKRFPWKISRGCGFKYKAHLEKRCQGSVGSQRPKLSSIFSIHRISFFLKSESDNYVQRLEWRLNYDMAPAQ